MTQLKDALPIEFISGEYDDTKAMKYSEVGVLEKRFDPWPGPQKNVCVWYVLENGKAVGWNENPGRGWSFPVITL